jgi:hypothetical protein
MSPPANGSSNQIRLHISNSPQYFINGIDHKQK